MGAVLSVSKRKKPFSVLHPPFERRLEMRIADIEIFKNSGGTVSVRELNSLTDSVVSFPIELIPSIVDMLHTIYNQNGGKSDIIPDKEGNDE